MTRFFAVYYKPNAISIVIQVDSAKMAGETDTSPVGKIFAVTHAESNKNNKTHI